MSTLLLVLDNYDFYLSLPKSMLMLHDDALHDMYLHNIYMIIYRYNNNTNIIFIM